MLRSESSAGEGNQATGGQDTRDAGKGGGWPGNVLSAGEVAGAATTAVANASTTANVSFMMSWDGAGGLSLERGRAIEGVQRMLRSVVVEQTSARSGLEEEDGTGTKERS